jgi:hypothetical protein
MIEEALRFAHHLLPKGSQTVYSDEWAIAPRVDVATSYGNSGSIQILLDNKYKG